MARPTRHGDWTPDEILLTLDAHLNVQGGASLRDLVSALAAELHREEGPVRDAIRAIDNIDTPDRSPGPSRVLVALGRALRDDPSEIRRLARNIRELWQQILDD